MLLRIQRGLGAKGRKHRKMQSADLGEKQGCPQQYPSLECELEVGEAQRVPGLSPPPQG